MRWAGIRQVMGVVGAVLMVVVLASACGGTVVVTDGATGGTAVVPSSTVSSAGPNVPATLSYPIVDTGQTECYDSRSAISAPSAGADFYGQDAQYGGAQPAYALSQDGLTVDDQVTGLTWQRSPDTSGDGVIDSGDKLTWDVAVAYADELNAEKFGGYDDWRLPSIKELYSLIIFTGTDPNPQATSSAGLVPFIDTDYFAFAYGDLEAGERVIDAQYMSSTKYVSTTMGGAETAFGVNFADGRIKGYPIVDPTGASKTFYVICVRGNLDYGQNSYVDNGDGTISDKATGLMWSKADSGTGLDWQEALAYVQAMNQEGYLGHDDWRLPNAKELQSIVDYDRSPDTTGSAAIDPQFTCTSIVDEAGADDYAFYWSSTTHVRAGGSGEVAVYVSFGRALGYMSGRWMDVHGAGAQRADPKVGDAADYPEGRGPQGDAVRIYDYVRLVRGIAAP